MSGTATRADVGDALNKLFRDVADLQQQVTRPDVMATAEPTDPVFDSVTIDDLFLTNAISPIEPLPGQSAEEPLALTPGAYMDDIFIDVTWAGPSDGTATTYEVEMAKETDPGVFALAEFQVVGGTSLRFRALEPNTTYGFRVTARNAFGTRAGPTPLVFQTTTTGTDTTVPPQVTGVIVGRGATSVVVKFTPLTSGQAADVANGRGTYHIQISTSAIFATVAAEVFSGDQIVAFNDIIAQGTYYARVRAIDESGNIGAWSTIAGPAVAGGVIDSMILAGLDAAKITVGFLSASRIATGSLVADKLQTSSLTTANITLAGGSIKIGNPPTDGILINSQGIRAYTGGVVQVALDSTGTATFTGTISASAIWGGGIVGATISGGVITGGTITGTLIRTASTIPRIELDNANDSLFGGIYHKIEFHTNAGLWGGDDFIPGVIFANYTADPKGTMQIWGPRLTNAYGTGHIFIHNYGNGTSIIEMAAGGGFMWMQNYVFASHGGRGFLCNNIYSSSYPAFASASSSSHANALRADMLNGSYLSSWTAAGGDGGPTRWEALNGTLSGYQAIYASAFTVGSSRWTKKNIVDLPASFDKLDSLRPRSYVRIPNAIPPPEPEREIEERLPESVLEAMVPERNDERGEEWGFIADEMAEVYPECVDFINGEPFAINYMMLIPVLVGAVKDLRARLVRVERKK